MPRFYNSYQEATEALLNKQIEEATTKKEEPTEEEQAEQDKRENEFWIKVVEGKIWRRNGKNN